MDEALCARIHKVQAIKLEQTRIAFLQPRVVLVQMWSVRENGRECSRWSECRCDTSSRRDALHYWTDAVRSIVECRRVTVLPPPLTAAISIFWLGFVSNIFFSKDCSVHVDTARSPKRNEGSGSVPCARESHSGFLGWKNARWDSYRLGASYRLHGGGRRRTSR
ncbi:hypothetical protein DFH08DRAFT_890742 [Mycena albidolilacea]|uniref:Uncharacterized protein n=1 Tax=Mycena albidolilacea TaxID=1033008 RepID=A0AAD7EGQ7_9AGAR|nr:hypothetical protein DFH08DRAFT_890742 [Mycena albidolilacea]